MPFVLSGDEALIRQNIAEAISPQSFRPELIKNFLSQRKIRIDNFLIAMANPHLQKSMPFGALLADAYRVTLQYSPSDRKEVSLREAIEEQIERSYTERHVGIKPNGLLPFEELSGCLVVDGLSKLHKEDLESKFAAEVLQVEQPLVELERIFPDMRLFYNEGKIDALRREVETLKYAIAHPDQVPPRAFWAQYL